MLSELSFLLQGLCRIECDSRVDRNKLMEQNRYKDITDVLFLYKQCFEKVFTRNYHTLSHILNVVCSAVSGRGQLC